MGRRLRLSHHEAGREHTRRRVGAIGWRPNGLDAGPRGGVAEALSMALVA